MGATTGEFSAIERPTGEFDATERLAIDATMEVGSLAPEAAVEHYWEVLNTQVEEGLEFGNSIQVGSPEDPRYDIKRVKALEYGLSEYSDFALFAKQRYDLTPQKLRSGDIDADIDCSERLEEAAQAYLAHNTAIAIQIAKPDFTDFIAPDGEDLQPHLRDEDFTKYMAEKADVLARLTKGLRTQSLGERNFQHILKFVDGIVTVTEDEILEATRVLLLATDIVPEPSGAVTLAAALFHSDRLPEAKKIVAVVSGGNIDPALKEELLTVEA